MRVFIELSIQLHKLVPALPLALADNAIKLSGIRVKIVASFLLRLRLHGHGNLFFLLLRLADLSMY